MHPRRLCPPWRDTVPAANRSAPRLTIAPKQRATGGPEHQLGWRLEKLLRLFSSAGTNRRNSISNSASLGAGRVAYPPAPRPARLIVVSNCSRALSAVILGGGAEGLGQQNLAGGVAGLQFQVLKVVFRRVVVVFLIDEFFSRSSIASAVRFVW